MLLLVIGLTLLRGGHDIAWMFLTVAPAAGSCTLALLDDSVERRLHQIDKQVRRITIAGPPGRAPTGPRHRPGRTLVDEGCDGGGPPAEPHRRIAVVHDFEAPKSSDEFVTWLADHELLTATEQLAEAIATFEKLRDELRIRRVRYHGGAA